MAALTTAFGPVVRVAVGGLLAAGFVRQCRKPFSRAGRLVLHRMNESHANVTRWGLSHVVIGEEFTVLDVGCGGGRTIETLATAASKGKVFGIDYSEQSVAVARETNRVLIERGRVDVQLGSVSQLPFSDQTFDLVTAVETHYYWPDLSRDVQEVMRVLKPGGTFLIIAETYRGRRNDWLYRPVMKLLLRAAYLSVEEHRRLLVNAGYQDVDVFVERTQGWISAKAHR